MINFRFYQFLDPCKKDLLIIEEFITENDNIKGIYIALEKDSQKVNQFAKELDLKSIIVLDKFKSIAKRHGVMNNDQASLPKTFLIDAEGYVLAIFSMGGEDFTDILKKYLP